MMITIDLVHEYEGNTEKPQNRATAGGNTWSERPLDPIYILAGDRHAELVHAAHQIRLARAARAEVPEVVPVDVQRYTEKTKNSVSMVERYVRRIFRLAE